MAKKNRITVGGNFPRPGQTGRSTIILTQAQRFNIDIANYMAAIKNAENVDYTRRVKLYDLYSEILTDTHLSSVIEKRKSAILFTPIVFKRKGETDEKIKEQLESPWFLEFLSDLWDSKLWGFSLFQFYMDKEWLKYDLIPRKHVDPVRKTIMRQQVDITGESFDNFFDLLFVGKSDNLGELAKSAPHVIYKRNTTGDWAQFSEIFGSPVREYTYDGNDENARAQIINDANNDGGAAVVIHPEGSGFNFVESNNKTGTVDVYDRFIARCNSELSKQYLGNTLTTEASEKGTQALGTVQKEGEETINKADEKFILNVLNYEMYDIFTGFGFNTKGGKFEFEKIDKVNLKELLEIVTKLHDLGLPISADYLYETFGVEKPENYEELINNIKQKIKEQEPELEPNPDPEPEPTPAEKKKFSNWLSGFFDWARRDRALEW